MFNITRAFPVIATGLLLAAAPGRAQAPETQGFPPSPGMAPHKERHVGEEQPAPGAPRMAATRTLNFASGRYELKPEMKTALDDVARALAADPNAVARVEGHTDSVGSERYNLRLAQERAQSVEQYLAGKGIEPRRIQTVGFGAAVPVADNSTEAGRAKNRRVAITIAPTQPPAASLR